MSDYPLVLTLDVAGEPLRWIDHETAAYYYAKELVAWSMGGDNHTMYGGTRRIDGERSSLTFNTIIAIKGQLAAKSANRRSLAPALTNTALFRRDHHVCAYCGEEFPNAKLSRDHVVPRSMGGQDKWENVVTACKSCNHRKGDRMLLSVGMELLYVPYAPCKNEHMILMNKKILTDQMDFLKSRIKNKDSRLL